jgi:tetratricopeptide (TPR) repeat protein
VLTAKKKINVRDAVPTSTTLDSLYAARDFVTENRNLVLGIGAAVVAVAALVYFYFSGKAADEISATRELRAVQSYIQQDQFKLAISGDPSHGVKGLQAIVDDYGGTNAGNLARLYLGNAYLYTGQYDKAFDAYDDVGGSPMIKAAGVSGLGAVYEARKEFAKAARMYEKSADMYKNDLLDAERCFNAGRDYAMAGDKAKAKEMFDRVKNAESPRFENEITRLTAQYQLDE